MSLTLIWQGLAMSNYIRPRRPGASVFLTIALAQRGTRGLVEHVEVLRAAVRKTRTERPFAIDAWVVLPDHMHCVWTLPPGDHDYSTRVQAIKAQFSRKVPMGFQRASHKARRERGVWQRRFWEHHIRDAVDYHNHIAYCWHNPVKHGFVEHPQDWRYSSWHRDHQ